MITVEKLIEELKKIPDHALCSAYEGEKCGLNTQWVDEKSNETKYKFIEFNKKET